MKKFSITSIFLFADGFCTVKIQDEQVTETDIKISKEALEGKTMDERYQYMTELANRYISCNQI